MRDASNGCRIAPNPQVVWRSEPAGGFDMDTLKYPVATEKAIRSIEADNTVTFIVDKRATKNMIKKEFETKFKVKPIDIRTLITTDGTKKALIRLRKENPAIDIATQLGLM